MGLTWESGFQGETCIKCMFVKNRDVILSGKAISLVFQASRDRLCTTRCFISQQEANKCWIGSAIKGGNWLNFQAIFKARHVNEPKWFSLRIFQVESS